MKNGWTSFQETDRKYDDKDKIKTGCAKKVFKVVLKQTLVDQLDQSLPSSNLLGMTFDYKILLY